MTRARLILFLALAAAVGLVAFAFGRGAAADERAGKRLVYLFVSGKGPQAKAWYDGGPPSGTQVQNALDKWEAEGYRFVAVASSGVATTVNVSSSTAAPPPSGDAAPGADFVVLLER